MSAKDNQPTDFRPGHSRAGCGERRPAVGGGVLESESITTNNNESGMIRNSSATFVNANQGIQEMATNTTVANPTPNKRGLRKNRRPDISTAQPPMRRRHGLSRTLEEAKAKRSAVIMSSQDTLEQATTTVTAAYKRGLRKKTHRPSSITTRAQPPSFRRGLFRTTEEWDAKITSAMRISANTQTVNNINQQGMISEQAANPSPIERGIARTVEDDLDGKIISNSSTNTSPRRARMKFFRRGVQKSRHHALALQQMDLDDIRELNESSIVDPEVGNITFMLDPVLCEPPMPTHESLPAVVGNDDRTELQIPTLHRYVHQRAQPSPGAVSIPPSSFEANLVSASQSDLSLVWDTTTSNLIEQQAREDLAEAQPVEEDESMQVAVETTLEEQKKNIPATRLMPLLVFAFLLFSGVVGGFICAGGTSRDSGEDSPSLVVTVETAAPTAYYRDEVEVEGMKLELMSLLENDDYFDVSEDKAESHALISREQALYWILHEDEMQLKAGDSNNLLQRYILTLFYFQTTQQSQWKECNPAPIEDGASHLASPTCFRPSKQYSSTRIHKHTVWGSPWLSAEHECQWAGVLCDRGRNVTELELVNNNLNGPLPWEVSKLEHLALLDLHKNNLTGTIPQLLGHLVHSMHSLKLASNKLKGSIPTELFSGGYIGNHTPRRIDLGWNSLNATIPTEIGKSNWEWVWLGENFLSGGIPMELFQCTSLGSLFLNGNRKIVGGIPTQIGLLTKLESLYLGGTSLHGAIPSEMALLSHLKMLLLPNSGLGGTIPQDLYAGISELSNLDVSDCSFSGTIGTYIGLWSKLRILKAANNNFSGLVPAEIGSLTDLHKITLNGNNFTAGTIPRSLCVLKNAVYLSYRNWELVADCTPDATTGVPLQACPEECCTICCDAETKICLAN